MKIGIVTQPLIANYGCFLQNFALQEVLKRLGHTPMTIDYLPTMSFLRYALHLAKGLVYNCIPGRKCSLKTYSVHRSVIFQQFVDEHINLTSTVHGYHKSIVSRYGFKAIITGSDQVWRPKFNHSVEDMFLKFVSQKEVRKIAYAASFGVDCWEYTKQQETACQKWAQRLDSVSVREHSAIELCKNHLGVDAVEVLDPTLLVDRSIYENVCKCVPVDKSSFVAVYILELTPEIKSKVDSLSEALNLSVKLFTANETASLTVPEWLSMFRDATYIITDSFHGSVFSIIFNKDFISIGNEKAGMSRFYSMLSKFHLENRLYVPGQTESNSLKEPIEWGIVYNELHQLKEKSLLFLEKALNN